MIAEAAIAMEFGASLDDIARTCHAHDLERGSQGGGVCGRQARDQFLRAFLGEATSFARQSRQGCPTTAVIQ